MECLTLTEEYIVNKVKMAQLKIFVNICKIIEIDNKCVKKIMNIISYSQNQ